MSSTSHADTAHATSNRTSPEALRPKPRGGKVWARIVWMAAAPAVLLLAAAHTATRGGGALGWADLVLWLAAAAAIGVRWLDIHRWAGTTAELEPATTSDWRSYSLRILITAAVAWVASHAPALLGG